MTFGEYISEARKKALLSQKDLAAKLVKEDGTSISAQYLNDIEHDRRNPPSDEIIEQLSRHLNLSAAYLHYLAGRIPPALRDDSVEPERFERVMQLFRRSMRGR